MEIRLTLSSREKTTKVYSCLGSNLILSNRNSTKFCPQLYSRRSITSWATNLTYRWKLQCSFMRELYDSIVSGQWTILLCTQSTLLCDRLWLLTMMRTLRCLSTNLPMARRNRRYSNTSTTIMVQERSI